MLYMKNVLIFSKFNIIYRFLFEVLFPLVHAVSLQYQTRWTFTHCKCQVRVQNTHNYAESPRLTWINYSISYVNVTVQLSQKLENHFSDLGSTLMLQSSIIWTV